MGNETLCYFVVLFDRELFHDQNFDVRLVAQTKAHVFFAAHIVSAFNAVQAFECAEEPLDLVALFVQGAVLFPGLDATGPRWDHQYHPPS
jgi:hypothetical protein